MYVTYVNFRTGRSCQYHQRFVVGPGKPYTIKFCLRLSRSRYSSTILVALPWVKERFGGLALTEFTDASVSFTLHYFVNEGYRSFLREQQQCHLASYVPPARRFLRFQWHLL